MVNNCTLHHGIIWALHLHLLLLIFEEKMTTKFATCSFLRVMAGISVIIFNAIAFYSNLMSLEQLF